MTSPPAFGSEAITGLLERLGARLDAQGLFAELYVVGGAAMALAYDARRATNDIDAIIRPREDVLQEARAMAVEEGLPADWLNDAVSQMMPPQQDDHPRDIADLPGVAVKVASPEYLLAMKTMTSRKSTGDLEDAATLCVLLGITSEAVVEDIIRRYFGPGDLGARELLIEDIVDRADQVRASSPAASTRGTPRALPGTCGNWLPRADRACGLPAQHRGRHR